MASWSPVAKRMSVSREEVEEAKRREAVKFLAWGRSLDHRKTTVARYFEERGWDYR